MGTLVLLAIASGSFLFLMVVSSVGTDTPETPPEPEVVILNDTITEYELDYSFRYMLQNCYYLELAQSTINIPLERTVSEEGILGQIVDLLGDNELKMFTRIPVEVTAGIDQSLISIVDFEYDDERHCISMMEVSLPHSRITQSRVCYQYYEATHLHEGHVWNSAQNIISFLVDASGQAEMDASEIAVQSGILSEADRRAKSQVRILLGSVGVENVRFVGEQEYVAGEYQ